MRIDSRACGELEVKNAVGILHYIHNGPMLENYSTKHEVALVHVKTMVFTVNHPTTRFQRLLNQRSIRYLSIEYGFPSQQSLDPHIAPIPLVLADLRAHIRQLTDRNDTDPKTRINEDQVVKKLEALLSRRYRPEEKLFLQRYPHLLEFDRPISPAISECLIRLKEVTELSETELEQIVKEHLYLLSPEERLKGLKPEEEEELLKLLLLRRKRLLTENVTTTSVT